MTRNILVFLLFIGLSFTASGQTFLVLEKMGTKKRYEFHPGEQMELMLNDDDFFTRINIVGLEDSLIITDFESITLERIKAVHLTGRPRYLKNWGPPLVVAGVILFAIDIINQTTGDNSGAYSPSAGITAASVSLITVGTIFTFSGRSKIKVRKWWRLRVVQI